jgi:hypothetical protein
MTVHARSSLRNCEICGKPAAAGHSKFSKGTPASTNGASLMHRETVLFSPWKYVEGYVRGCWAYFEDKRGRPFTDAGDLARWKQLYSNAGGTLPEEGQPGSIAEKLLPALIPDKVVAPGPQTAGTKPLQIIVLLPPPPAGGRRRLARLVASMAVGLILLTLGVIAGVSVGTGGPSQDPVNPAAHSALGGKVASILVVTPAPACGFAVQDGFRSPANTAFRNITQANLVSLDGFSATALQGTYKGLSYDWLESHPTGGRAGIQLRWSNTPDRWHYCTATVACR